MTETLSTNLLDRPLSFSQISCFLTCRYQWYLRYVLGIRPKQRAAALELGDAVHRGMAAFLSGEEPAEVLQAWYDEAVRNLPISDAEVEDRLFKMKTDAEIILARAQQGLFDAEYWSLTDKSGNPYVEAEFVVPVKGWKSGMVAKLDWVAYHPASKTTWVTDWKTRGYFTTDNDELANLQNVIYQYALAKKKIETDGTLTFQIKSTPPKQPKLNQNGEMSRAAIDCDWQTYQSALIENGLSPFEYQDMKAKLEDKEFVRLTRVVRSSDTVARIWRDVIEPIAAAMAASVQHWQKYPVESERIQMLRNLSPRTCSYCGVRPICHGNLNGWDVANALEADFTSSDVAKLRFYE